MARENNIIYMITGMINPNKGHVFLDNLDITSDPMYKKEREKGLDILHKSHLFLESLLLQKI